MRPEDLIKQLEKQLYVMDFVPETINQGKVDSCGDGIVKATGLSKAGLWEEVEFENNARGLVLNMDEDYVSIILLSGNTAEIIEGTKVKTTGKILGVTVSENLIGRVIDPLQNPLDGKELKLSGKFYPVEKIAPGVINRQPVDSPVKTGIKAIDSMIPIGRGQRELIIGDRNTGKTAIAIDTIINQKKKDLGLKQLICIYCAIGQKASNIARIVARLEEEGAMDYTIIVSSTAADPAAVQYIAPYSACAIGEYFMDKGEDVLIIYDDLSKHAWAYRQLSLLIKRPAGREAYPGDIFSIHSQLLERSARLSKENGGGSLTALPIIETQANDISGYIATNVISITDGQIYLESDLFNSGIRPALNVGLSVSRVGSSAQSKAMKHLAGPLRIELAQFSELQAFVQFSTDLDESTLKRIERGKRITEILKQPQFTTFDEVSEIISIFSAISGLLDDIPVNNIKELEIKMLAYIKTNKKQLINRLLTEKTLDSSIENELKDAISEFKKTQG